MAALAVGGDAQGGVALLGDPDHRDGRVQDRIVVDDQEALVQREGRLDAARLQRVGDRLGPADLADHLLVVSGDDQDGAPGLEALAGQGLGGLHQRHQRALVVDRAAAPDRAVPDGAGEGRGLPLAQGLVGDRHHVLVGHQDDRLERGIGALPGVDQGAVADDLARRDRVELRIGLDQPGALGVPLGAVVLGRVLVRDGLELHRLRQAVRRLGRIDRNLRGELHPVEVGAGALKFAVRIPTTAASTAIAPAPKQRRRPDGHPRPPQP